MITFIAGAIKSADKKETACRVLSTCCSYTNMNQSFKSEVQWGHLLASICISLKQYLQDFV